MDLLICHSTADRSGRWIDTNTEDGSPSERSQAIIGRQPIFISNYSKQAWRVVSIVTTGEG